MHKDKGGGGYQNWEERKFPHFPSDIQVFELNEEKNGTLSYEVES